MSSHQNMKLDRRRWPRGWTRYKGEWARRGGTVGSALAFAEAGGRRPPSSLRQPISMISACSYPVPNRQPGDVYSVVSRCHGPTRAAYG
jgi:hypothetical protein